ncbi:HAD-like domain-containing protein [Tribonema minus]|uniref:HAD-like domain-containing protein n=1 Tax=Tribonema minus TaxID=303371 RepID=A0A835ZE39_9STRA|nr:HAD-like domain-containing protein [Tribonema minus]
MILATSTARISLLVTVLASSVCSGVAFLPPCAKAVSQAGMTPRLHATDAAATATEAPAQPSPAHIKGCLFDMDGTLVDSDELHFEAYRDIILEMRPDHNGGKPIDKAWYKEWMSGNSNAVITARLFPDMPLAQQEEMWDRKEALYRRISTAMAPLPGLARLLEWCDLEDDDKARIATIIVTNAPRLDARHTMEVLGIHERFGNTVVIGAECARAKPHPEPYLEGLRRLGLAARDCIAFEDSLNGCRSATAAGLFTVGVTTGLDEAALRGAGAGVCIADFTDERLWALLGAQMIFADVK